MRFEAKFSAENEAFSLNLHAEIARVLRGIAERLDAGEFYGVCMDANGNRVGEWDILRDDES